MSFLGVRSIEINGKMHKIHAACWKAILVAERLNPSPNMFENMSLTSGFVGFEIREPNTEEEVVVRHFKNKELQAP